MRRYLLIGLGLPLCALIFLADLAAPLGVAVWLGYVVVAAFAAWYGQRRLALGLAALSTLLIILGYFLSPPGLIPWITAVNRSAGILLVWGTVFLVADRRRLLDTAVEDARALNEANERLAEQKEALLIANDELERRADELAGVNEMLHNQTEEVEVQAEELRAQNDELVMLNDNLEQRVVQRTTELRQANESLQEMSARLIAVQENERRSISRELHDESGQVLSAIIIRLGLLRSLWERGESPVAAIDELVRLADQLADGLHRLAVNLRPASLDRAGLIAALEQYIETYGSTHNVRVDFYTQGMDGARLSPEVESTLYRIIQEALTNVARHAQARHVGVAVSQQEGVIQAVIEDDGVGFDLQEALRSGRLGVTGMRERAELRGGKLTVDSQPGAGTTVFVEIPCPPRGHDAAPAPRSKV